MATGARSLEQLEETLGYGVVVAVAAPLMLVVMLLDMLINEYLLHPDCLARSSVTRRSSAKCLISSARLSCLALTDAGTEYRLIQLYRLCALTPKEYRNFGHREVLIGDRHDRFDLELLGEALLCMLCFHRAPLSSLVLGQLCALKMPRRLRVLV